MSMHIIQADILANIKDGSVGANIQQLQSWVQNGINIPVNLGGKGGLGQTFAQTIGSKSAAREFYKSLADGLYKNKNLFANGQNGQKLKQIQGFIAENLGFSEKQAENFVKGMINGGQKYLRSSGIKSISVPQETFVSPPSSNTTSSSTPVKSSSQTIIVNAPKEIQEKIPVRRQETETVKETTVIMGGGHSGSKSTTIGQAERQIQEISKQIEMLNNMAIGTQEYRDYKKMYQQAVSEARKSAAARKKKPGGQRMPWAQRSDGTWELATWSTQKEIDAYDYERELNHAMQKQLYKRLGMQYNSRAIADRRGTKTLTPIDTEIDKLTEAFSKKMPGLISRQKEIDALAEIVKFRNMYPDTDNSKAEALLSQVSKNSFKGMPLENLQEELRNLQKHYESQVKALETYTFGKQGSPKKAALAAAQAYADMQAIEEELASLTTRGKNKQPTTPKQEPVITPVQTPAQQPAKRKISISDLKKGSNYIYGKRFTPYDSTGFVPLTKVDLNNLVRLNGGSISKKVTTITSPSVETPREIVLPYTTGNNNRGPAPSRTIGSFKLGRQGVVSGAQRKALERIVPDIPKQSPIQTDDLYDMIKSGELFKLYGLNPTKDGIKTGTASSVVRELFNALNYVEQDNAYTENMAINKDIRDIIADTYRDQIKGKVQGFSEQEVTSYVAQMLEEDPRFIRPNNSIVNSKFPRRSVDPTKGYWRPRQSEFRELDIATGAISKHYLEESGFRRILNSMGVADDPTAMMWVKGTNLGTRDFERLQDYINNGLYIDGQLYTHAGFHANEARSGMTPFIRNDLAPKLKELTWGGFGVSDLNAMRSLSGAYQYTPNKVGNNAMASLTGSTPLDMRKKFEVSATRANGELYKAETSLIDSLVVIPEQMVSTLANVWSTKIKGREASGDIERTSKQLEQVLTDGQAIISAEATKEINRQMRALNPEVKNFSVGQIRGEQTKANAVSFDFKQLARDYISAGGKYEDLYFPTRYGETKHLLDPDVQFLMTPKSLKIADAYNSTAEMRAALSKGDKLDIENTQWGIVKNESSSKDNRVLSMQMLQNRGTYTPEELQIIQQMQWKSFEEALSSPEAFMKFTGINPNSMEGQIIKANPNLMNSKPYLSLIADKAFTQSKNKIGYFDRASGGQISAEAPFVYGISDPVEILSSLVGHGLGVYKDANGQTRTTYSSVPMVKRDAQGNPIFDANGKPTYTYESGTRGNNTVHSNEVFSPIAFNKGAVPGAPIASNRYPNNIPSNNVLVEAPIFERYSLPGSDKIMLFPGRNANSIVQNGDWDGDMYETIFGKGYTTDSKGNKIPNRSPLVKELQGMFSEIIAPEINKPANTLITQEAIAKQLASAFGSGKDIGISANGITRFLAEYSNSFKTGSGEDVFKAIAGSQSPEAALLAAITHSYSTIDKPKAGYQFDLTSWVDEMISSGKFPAMQRYVDMLKGREDRGSQYQFLEEQGVNATGLNQLTTLMQELKTSAREELRAKQMADRGSLSTIPEVPKKAVEYGKFGFSGSELFKANLKGGTSNQPYVGTEVESVISTLNNQPGTARELADLLVNQFTRQRRSRKYQGVSPYSEKLSSIQSALKSEDAFQIAKMSMLGESSGLETALPLIPEQVLREYNSRGANAKFSDVIERSKEYYKGVQETLTKITEIKNSIVPGLDIEDWTNPATGELIKGARTRLAEMESMIRTLPQINQSQSDIISRVYGKGNNLLPEKAFYPGIEGKQDALQLALPSSKLKSYRMRYQTHAGRATKYRVNINGVKGEWKDITDLALGEQLAQQLIPTKGRSAYQIMKNNGWDSYYRWNGSDDYSTKSMQSSISDKAKLNIIADLSENAKIEDIQKAYDSMSRETRAGYTAPPIQGASGALKRETYTIKYKDIGGQSKSVDVQFDNFYGKSNEPVLTSVAKKYKANGDAYDYTGRSRDFAISSPDVMQETFEKYNNQAIEDIYNEVRREGKGTVNTEEFMSRVRRLADLRKRQQQAYNDNRLSGNHIREGILKFDDTIPRQQRIFMNQLNRFLSMGALELTQDNVITGNMTTDLVAERDSIQNAIKMAIGEDGKSGYNAEYAKLVGAKFKGDNLTAEQIATNKAIDSYIASKAIKSRTMNEDQLAAAKARIDEINKILETKTGESYIDARKTSSTRRIFGTDYNAYQSLTPTEKLMTEFAVKYGRLLKDQINGLKPVSATGLNPSAESSGVIAEGLLQKTTQELFGNMTPNQLDAYNKASAAVQERMRAQGLFPGDPRFKEMARQVDLATKFMARGMQLSKANFEYASKLADGAIETGQLFERTYVDSESSGSQATITRENLLSKLLTSGKTKKQQAEEAAAAREDLYRMWDEESSTPKRIRAGGRTLSWSASANVVDNTIANLQKEIAQRKEMLDGKIIEGKTVGGLYQELAQVSKQAKEYANLPGGGNDGTENFIRATAMVEKGRTLNDRIKGIESEIADREAQIKAETARARQYRSFAKSEGATLLAPNTNASYNPANMLFQSETHSQVPFGNGIVPAGYVPTAEQKRLIEEVKAVGQTGAIGEETVDRLVNGIMSTAGITSDYRLNWEDPMAKKAAETYKNGKGKKFTEGYSTPDISETKTAKNPKAPNEQAKTNPYEGTTPINYNPIDENVLTPPKMDRFMPSKTITQHKTPVRQIRPPRQINPNTSNVAQNAVVSTLDTIGRKTAEIEAATAGYLYPGDQEKAKQEQQEQIRQQKIMEDARRRQERDNIEKERIRKQQEAEKVQEERLRRQQEKTERQQRAKDRRAQIQAKAKQELDPFAVLANDMREMLNPTIIEPTISSQGKVDRLEDIINKAREQTNKKREEINKRRQERARRNQERAKQNVTASETIPVINNIVPSVGIGQLEAVAAYNEVMEATTNDQFEQMIARTKRARQIFEERQQAIAEQQAKANIPKSKVEPRKPQAPGRQTEIYQENLRSATQITKPEYDTSAVRARNEIVTARTLGRLFQAADESFRNVNFNHLQNMIGLAQEGVITSADFFEQTRASFSGIPKTQKAIDDILKQTSRIKQNIVTDEGIIKLVSMLEEIDKFETFQKNLGASSLDEAVRMQFNAANEAQRQSYIQSKQQENKMSISKLRDNFTYSSQTLPELFRAMAKGKLNEAYTNSITQEDINKYGEENKASANAILSRYKTASGVERITYDQMLNAIANDEQQNRYEELQKLTGDLNNLRQNRGRALGNKTKVSDIEKQIAETEERIKTLNSESQRYLASMNPKAFSLRDMQQAYSDQINSFYGTSERTVKGPMGKFLSGQDGATKTLAELYRTFRTGGYGSRAFAESPRGLNQQTIEQANTEALNKINGRIEKFNKILEQSQSGTGLFTGKSDAERLRLGGLIQDRISRNQLQKSNIEKRNKEITSLRDKLQLLEGSQGKAGAAEKLEQAYISGKVKSRGDYEVAKAKLDTLIEETRLRYETLNGVSTSPYVKAIEGKGRIESFVSAIGAKIGERANRIQINKDFADQQIENALMGWANSGSQAGQMYRQNRYGQAIWQGSNGSQRVTAFGQPAPIDAKTGETFTQIAGRSGTGRVRAIARTANAYFEGKSGQAMGKMMGAEMVWGRALGWITQFYGYTKAINDEMRLYQKIQPDWDTKDMNQYVDGLAKIGLQYGKTKSEMIDASQLMTRAGYGGQTDSLKELNTGMTQAAILMSNVADEEQTVDDATNAIVSAVKAWDVADEDAVKFAQHYADAANEISNNYAVTSNGLTNNLSTTAAMAATNGMSIDQALALITTGAEISQNPAKTSTAMKTIIGRFNQINDRETSTTGAWLYNFFEGENSTGQKINYRNAEGQLDFYAMVQDMYANVWDKLSQDEQALFAQKIAGSRQASNWANWMQNGGKLEEIRITSENSFGSASRSNEAMMNSIEGATAKLNAAKEQFFGNALSSDFFIGAISAFAGAINMLNETPIIRTAAGLSALGVAIGSFANYLPMLLGFVGHGALSGFAGLANLGASVVGGIADARKRGSLINPEGKIGQFYTGFTGALTASKEERALIGKQYKDLSNEQIARRFGTTPDKIVKGANGSIIVNGANGGTQVIQGAQKVEAVGSQAARGAGSVAAGFGSAVASMLPMLGIMAAIAAVTALLSSISNSIDKGNDAQVKNFDNLVEQQKKVEATSRDYQAQMRDIANKQLEADLLAEGYTKGSEEFKQEYARGALTPNSELTDYQLYVGSSAEFDQAYRGYVNSQEMKKIIQSRLEDTIGGAANAATKQRGIGKIKDWLIGIDNTLGINQYGTKYGYDMSRANAYSDQVNELDYKSRVLMSKIAYGESAGINVGSQSKQLELINNQRENYNNQLQKIISDEEFANGFFKQMEMYKAISDGTVSGAIEKAEYLEAIGKASAGTAEQLKAGVKAFGIYDDAVYETVAAMNDIEVEQEYLATDLRSVVSALSDSYSGFQKLGEILNGTTNSDGSVKEPAKTWETLTGEDLNTIATAFSGLNEEQLSDYYTTFREGTAEQREEAYWNAVDQSLEGLYGYQGIQDMDKYILGKYYQDTGYEYEDSIQKADDIINESRQKYQDQVQTLMDQTGQRYQDYSLNNIIDAVTNKDIVSAITNMEFDNTKYDGQRKAYETDDNGYAITWQDTMEDFLDTMTQGGFSTADVTKLMEQWYDQGNVLLDNEGNTLEYQDALANMINAYTSPIDANSSALCDNTSALAAATAAFLGLENGDGGLVKDENGWHFGNNNSEGATISEQRDTSVETRNERWDTNGDGNIGFLEGLKGYFSDGWYNITHKPDINEGFDGQVDYSELGDGTGIETQAVSSLVGSASAVNDSLWYQVRKDAYEQYGNVFGNIDVFNRQLYDRGDGSWSTISGGWDEYGPNKTPIAYSPFVQGENGTPVELTGQQVDDYIYGLIAKNGGKVDDNLLNLDQQGIEGVKNLIAAIGPEAQTIADTMHYVAEYGEANGLVSYQDQLNDLQNKYNIDNGLSDNVNVLGVSETPYKYEDKSTQGKYESDVPDIKVEDKTAKIKYEADVENIEVPEIPDQQFDVQANTASAQLQMDKLANTKLTDKTITVDAVNNAQLEIDKIKNAVDGIPTSKTISVIVSGAKAALDKLASLKGGQAAKGGTIGHGSLTGERHADGGLTGTSNTLGVWLGDEYKGSGEKKPELVVTPDGNAHLAGLSGWEYEQLPKGTRVYSNTDTKKMLGSNYNLGGYIGERHADGGFVGQLHADTGVVKYNRSISNLTTSSSSGSGNKSSGSNNKSSGSGSGSKNSTGNKSKDTSNSTAKATANIEGYVEDISDKISDYVKKYGTMIKVITDQIDLLQYTEEKSDVISERRFELEQQQLDTLNNYKTALEGQGATVENSSDYRSVLSEIEKLNKNIFDQRIKNMERMIDVSEFRRDQLINQYSDFDNIDLYFDSIEEALLAEQEQYYNIRGEYVQAGYDEFSDEIMDIDRKIMDNQKDIKDFWKKAIEQIADDFSNAYNSTKERQDYFKWMSDEFKEDLNKQQAFEQQKYDDETERLNKLDKEIDRAKKIQDAEADLVDAQKKRVMVMTESGWQWKEDPRSVRDAQKNLDDVKESLDREKRDEDRAEAFKQWQENLWEQYFGPGSQGKEAYATEDSIYKKIEAIEKNQEYLSRLDERNEYYLRYGNQLWTEALNTEASEEELSKATLQFLNSEVMDMLDSLGVIPDEIKRDADGGVDILGTLSAFLNDHPYDKLNKTQQHTVDEILAVRNDTKVSQNSFAKYRTEFDAYAMTNCLHGEKQIELLQDIDETLGGKIVKPIEQQSKSVAAIEEDTTKTINPNNPATTMKDTKAAQMDSLRYKYLSLNRSILGFNKGTTIGSNINTTFNITSTKADASDVYEQVERGLNNAFAGIRVNAKQGKEGYTPWGGNYTGGVKDTAHAQSGSNAHKFG